MRRRECLTLIGGAAVARPLAARAQQPALPVIGFLHRGYPSGAAAMVAGLREGLSEAGFFESRNVAIEYRWAEGQTDRVPALAADLVRHRPAVLFASGPDVVRALKAQTAAIPIVFSMGEDPVKEGLVASLNRPGGNVTGFSTFTNQLFGKRLELLRQIVPNTALVAILVNPTNPNAGPDTAEAKAAADALGMKLQVTAASTERDLASGFDAIAQRQVGGLMVGVDAFFQERREQIVALAIRHAIPAIYERRDYAAAGGLMSYGAYFQATWRGAGLYLGRILKGESPADLPVQQSAKFEFVINLRTAKVLGLTVPPTLLDIADEVIE